MEYKAIHRTTQNLFRLRLMVLTLLFLSALCAALPVRAAPQTYGTLLSYDFDTNSWAGAVTQAVGTIDVLGSAQPSLGLSSSSSISSGPLPLNTPETNLGKLTLAFSLSASAAKPVTVTIQSYDASKNRTGSLQTLIYPAAPNFYQRYALDLSTFQPSGAGTFVPNAPYVSFTFSVGGAAWQGVANPQIQLDNVNYALPAYYVSNSGNDNTNTGRSEAQAYATVQKAVNAAQAGDIVVVRNGTYNGTGISSSAEGGTGAVASFPRAGTPANWIVLKNYPGEIPLLWSNAWNIINISKGSNTVPDTTTVLAYLEVRGVHIRGQGDLIYNNGQPGGLYPGTIGQPVSQSNSNGISIDGRYMTNMPHHIRLANNFVEYCPAAGIGAGEGDWITFENNTLSNNCWTNIYACSGVSLSGSANYDTVVNAYTDLIRNNVCYGNQCYEMWASQGRYSDGNGIICDTNYGTGFNPNGSHLGRTLVQGNLSFHNGGSGIHAFESNHVDIISNTAYLNSASVHLQYGEIFAAYNSDVNIYNNILVAPVANTAAGEQPEPVNSANNSTNVTYSHNLYFGGNIAPIMGTGDVIADPQFRNPSIDPTVADFHLKTTSPARSTGLAQPYSPFLDLDGNPRAATPDKGVYQLTQTTTALASSLNPAPVGSSITLTATITGSNATGEGNTPTGTVTFNDGGTTLGTTTLINNLAAFSTSSLAMGSRSLTATYSGDDANTPSTSSVLTQSIKAVPVATGQNVTTLLNHALPITLSGSDANTPPLTLRYVVTAAPVHGILSGTAPILTYTPTAGYAGTDSFSFSVSNGFFPSTAATVSVNIIQASVSGTVTLQGWTGAAQPLTFMLTPTDSTGGSVLTQTLTPATGGAFTLSSVAPGTYRLLVKGSKWLQKAASVDTTGGNVTSLALTLLTGDVNNDNSVTGTDYLILRSTYGKKSGQTGYDSRADLNGDNSITGTDYLLLRANYGKSGDK